jgi:transposase
MDAQVTATYCLIDDFLRSIHHREPTGRSVSDAEVLTVALVAARCYRGNSEAAWRFLTEYGYMVRRLSRSQYNRRLHAAAPLAERLFEQVAELWKTTGNGGAFAIDSMPIPCCDNARIRRSRLFPPEETDGAFRGYQSSKRRFFYGLKLHAVVNEHGRPVEIRLTPGSHSDTGELKNFDLDLPAGSVVCGDKAYTDYTTEDVLEDAAEVRLLADRKANSTRPRPAWETYVLQVYRKAVETAFGEIEKLLPKSIHAVTGRGFVLKVYLFVLAYSLSGLC